MKISFSRVAAVSFAILFFGPANGGALLAQEEEEPIINVDFSVYSLSRLEGIKFVNGDRDGAIPVSFYSSSRSEAYTYSGPSPIIFFTEEPAPTADSAEAVRRIKVAEIDIPVPRGEFLFIFFPDDTQDKESYRIFPLDDSTRAHPYGSIRLFNATPYTLEGVLGSERIRLRPGPGEFYRMRGNSVSLGLGFQHDGKFHQSFNSPLHLDDDSRGLMMLFPPFVKGSAILQTRFLRQARADEPTLEIDNVDATSE